MSESMQPGMFWDEPLDMLFVGAHPDDVELFCGGTIARFVKAGYRVGLADLTRGEMASNGSPEIRRAESLEAAKRLGVRLPRPVLGLPDGALSGSEASQRQRCFEFLDAVRTRMIFAPYPRDRHPDHVAAGELIAHAWARLQERSQTDWTSLVYYPCHEEIQPTFLVEIDDEIEISEKALEAYASQFVQGESSVLTPINEVGFLQHRRNRRRLWGASIGCMFAEGFLSLQPMRVDDPLSSLCPDRRKDPS